MNDQMSLFSDHAIDDQVFPDPEDIRERLLSNDELLCIFKLDEFRAMRAIGKSFSEEELNLERRLLNWFENSWIRKAAELLAAQGAQV